MDRKFGGFIMSDCRYEIAVEKINNEEDIRVVIDVGCGELFGDNFRCLERKDVYVIGVELYKENLPILGNNDKINKDIVIADGRKLPFRSNSADICIDYGTSKNFKEGKEIIDEVARVSRRYAFRFADINYLNFNRELESELKALEDRNFRIREYRIDPFAARVLMIGEKK